MKTENVKFLTSLPQFVLQDIKKSFEGAHLDAKNYWKLPVSLWNSTIVTTVPKHDLNKFFFSLSTGMYTSKSGSKSFDELDDILGEKVKKTHSSPHSSMIDDTSRHSCDELMMTRSLYEAETSDSASQVWLIDYTVCLKFSTEICSKMMNFIE